MVVGRLSEAAYNELTSLYEEAVDFLGQIHWSWTVSETLVTVAEKRIRSADRYQYIH